MATTPTPISKASAAKAPSKAVPARASAPKGSGHAAKKKLDESVPSGPKARLPFIGDVELPEPAHLIYYVGVGALVALELVEWPIAVILAVGKILADNRHSKILQGVGEALEEVG